MRKKIQTSAFLLILSLFGCNNTDKNQIIYATEIYKDFPKSEKLEFKPFNKYNIKEFGICFMNDSILWYLEDNTNIIGHCYNLNTGKQLSVIGTIGKAKYEFLEEPSISFVGDSVQFHTINKDLKIFSQNDILENKPMGERKFSVVNVPDSLSVLRMTRLQNGNTLATIEPTTFLYNKPKRVECELNKRDVLLFNDKEAKSYNSINYNSFENGNEEGSRENFKAGIKDQIKLAYANGGFLVKNNDLAVFFASSQFILYTFDIKNGKTLKEKRYTNFKATDQHGSPNDLQLRINYALSNDKYILCYVSGYFSTEDKEAKLKKNAIFIFDWDLNPIKRFDLPEMEVIGGYGNYRISNDCNSVYLCEYPEDGEYGLILHKADINI